MGKLTIIVSERLTVWEASELAAKEAKAHKGRISSGAVKAFIVGARKRRDARARKLEGLTQALNGFLASDVGAPLNTDTANPAMLAWLNS